MSDLIEMYNQARDTHIKNIHKKFGNQDIFENRMDTFHWACANECLLTMEWLHDNYNDFIVEANIIEEAYSANNTMILEYLLDKYANVVVDAKDIIIHTSALGKIDALKLLLSKYPIADTEDQCNLFHVACANNRLHIVEWLLDTYPCIQINDISSMTGLSVIKYLVNRFPSIDIHADNCSAFRLACHARAIDIVDFYAKITINQDISYHRGTKNIYGYLPRRYGYIVSLTKLDILNEIDADGIYIYIIPITRTLILDDTDLEHVISKIRFTKLHETVIYTKKSAK